MGSAAAIARQLRATRRGRDWRCDCPCGCGYGLSLSDGEGGQLLVFCFGSCSFDRIMAALVEYGLLDGDDNDNLPAVQPAAAHQRDAIERIALAREIYAAGAPDERIGIYLRSRNIDLVSPALRFTERAPHRLGARLPAMLAPVLDVSGEQTGLHATYLRCDGGGKADLPKEYQRECRGVIRGGAIRLAEHDPGAALVVAEGVESTFAAMQIFGLPGWSAIFAGGLKTIELPLVVRRIVIAADNDISGAGQRSAIAAHDRWVAEGRSVRIKTPPDVGHDFNDVLIKRRPDVRHG
jgi:putative DNA primase/helicase